MNDDGYSTEVFVDLDQIDEALRPASQMRVSPNAEAIASYAENLDALPAILLMCDPATGLHWVPDGCHRCLAARELGRRQIKARVKVGTYLDAFREAARANETHGIRLTNEDKVRRIVEASRDPVMGGWSNGRLALWCGVNDDTVARHRVWPGRQDGDLDADQGRVIGADGKKYPAKKRQPRAKGKAKAKPGPPSNGEPVVDAGASDPPDDVPAFDEESDPDPTPVMDAPTPIAPAPEDREEGSLDLLGLWRREEGVIMGRYRAWPDDLRGYFVMRLLGLGEQLRNRFHPDIEDLSHLPLN